MIDLISLYQFYCLFPRVHHYLLEGELGVAGGTGETVDAPGLVQGRHH